MHSAGRLDGFGLYLYGIVLRELRMTGIPSYSSSTRLLVKGWARSVLADAVNAYPCNWSAWLDLASVCADFERYAIDHSSPPVPFTYIVDSVRVLKLSDHWMRDFFMAHMLLELQQNCILPFPFPFPLYA